MASEFGIGTNRTSHDVRLESAFRGKRKSDFGAVGAAFDPERTPKSSDSVCEITIRAGQTDPGALPGLI